MICQPYLERPTQSVVTIDLSTQVFPGSLADLCVLAHI